MENAETHKQNRFTCGWHNCEVSIIDKFDEFKIHVVSHTYDLSSDQQQHRCYWNNCNLTIEGDKSLLRLSRHLLVHCHIANLMIKGDINRNKRGLTPCHLPARLSKELVHHSLEKPRECGWRSCSYMTDDVDEFFQHVNTHLKRFVSERGEAWMCRWNNCKDAETNKIFRHSGNLRIHLRGHTGEKLLACSSCQRQFACVENFNDHLKKQMIDDEEFRETRDYTCKDCGKAFARRPELDVHRRRFHRPRVKCPHCDRTFLSRAHALQHLRVHNKSSPEKHTCPYCLISLNTRHALLQHAREKHNMSKLFCPDCDFETNATSEIWRHFYKLHNRRLYSCHICGYRTNQDAPLGDHLRKEHSLEPDFGYQRFIFEMSDHGIYQMKRSIIKKKVGDPDDDHNLIPDDEKFSDSHN